MGEKIDITAFEQIYLLDKRIFYMYRKPILLLECQTVLL